MKETRKLGAIILAAGKGKRMQSGNINKVALFLHNKPIVSHIVHFMKKMAIETIVVVIGYAKESVMQTLQADNVLFVEQKERLGTGHAVQVALDVLPGDVTDVFVVYGDDAVLYNSNHLSVIEKVFTKQMDSNAAVTFLTIEVKDSQGLGRIIRDEHGKVLAIIEEKDATEDQRKITEINPGCFVFRVSFLKTYLPKVEQNPLTQEYYLTDLIDLAIKDHLLVQTVKGGHMAWRGVNTKEELQEAEILYKRMQSEE